MNNIPRGSFWVIKKPFDPSIYFQMNKYQLLSQEKLTTYNSDKLKKLWRRKYLFFGSIYAASLETKDFFFFYEPHPGQLYYCDIPNFKISKATNQLIYCFFWYPDAKSCGLKIYQNNELIRHIESEADYAITVNKGGLLETEDTLISISKCFNQNQLAEYLRNSKVDMPEEVSPSIDLNTTLYKLIR